MPEAYIIDAIRTPIGKLRGALSPIRADDLAAMTIKELLNRNPEIDPGQIEDVIFGCANQAGEDNRNVARMAALLAGLPVTVPGETVNRLCASGMSSAAHSYRAIKVGEGELFITGGMEHMTRGPMVLGKGAAPYSGTNEMHDTTFGWRFVNPRMEEQYGSEAMGETAENIVDEYGISREDQDKYAAWSQQKAANAIDTGRMAKEIMPVEIPRQKGEPETFDTDEYIRPSTTVEILSKLKPAFRTDGTVTAGNASGINDGSCAMLIAGEGAINEFNLDPKAKIVASAVVGVAPCIMGMGPVGATEKVLQRTGLSLDDMHIIELNEAFAAQNLAVLRELGLADHDERITYKSQWWSHRPGTSAGYVGRPPAANGDH